MNESFEKQAVATLLDEAARFVQQGTEPERSDRFLAWVCALRAVTLLHVEQFAGRGGSPGDVEHRAHGIASAARGGLPDVRTVSPKPLPVVVIEKIVEKIKVVEKIVEVPVSAPVSAPAAAPAAATPAARSAAAAKRPK